MTSNPVEKINTAVSIEDQLKCVRRELAMRQRVYPRWVAQSKMKQEAADRELAAMQAVHDTVSGANDLAKVLKDARDAIASLDQAALGFANGTSSMGEPMQWPIRDELLEKIDAALAKVGA